jgi:polyferredoxin
VTGAVSPYSLAADAVLVTHALFVAFVVIGQVLILAGLALGWRWVRNRRFRLAHLAAIGIVVLQAWLGVLCPLTILENALRRRSGEAAYAGSFIEHWLHRVIYYDAEPWVFTVTYSAFAGVVAATWYFGRPVR